MNGVVGALRSQLEAIAAKLAPDRHQQNSER